MHALKAIRRKLGFGVLLHIVSLLLSFKHWLSYKAKRKIFLKETLEKLECAAMMGSIVQRKKVNSSKRRGHALHSLFGLRPNVCTRQEGETREKGCKQGPGPLPNPAGQRMTWMTHLSPGPSLNHA